MERLVLLAVVCLGAVLGAAGQPTWISNLPGPPESCSADVIRGIQWGTATSAYQVEGGWDADGKSPSVWDVLAQTPGRIADNTTGNVACDMYHRWQSDINLMKQLGVKHYRMSISWPRVVPGGVAGSPINMAGIAWYRAFIQALLAAGIKPAVTLFHWDLPQGLQERYQGFLSPQVQRDYVYYADAVFKHLGDLVDQWMTFNEVISICELGYELDVFAPAMKLGKKAKYTCGHNILLAHAKTVQLYRTKYQPTQGGRVSIALDGKWGFPKDPNNPADVKAADNFMVFQYAWMADPLYFGDYPQIMKDTQGADLPKFTEQEKALLRATTIDFFSVNFYCGYYVWAPKPGSPPDVTFDVFENGAYTSPGTPTNAAWLFKTPDGFRNTLVWLHKRYNGPEFWVTENGVSGPGEESKRYVDAVRDEFRLGFYNSYLDNMCKAKTVDGVKVSHYFAWSLMDNFEWRDGFSRRFGLVYIDLEDNLARHPKSTAYWFSKHFFQGSQPAFTAKQKQVAAAAAAATAATTSSSSSSGKATAPSGGAAVAPKQVAAQLVAALAKAAAAKATHVHKVPADGLPGGLAGASKGLGLLPLSINVGGEDQGFHFHLDIGGDSSST